ncbi:MAG TPA: DUF3626 domain-containing protein [Trebonia sp.]
MTDPHRLALAFVRARSAGEPADRRARITLHFHPDRDFRGISVLESLLRDGVYRSQFETGTSNGGLTAYPGGDRWRWESRMFDGAYDTARAGTRPVYGALNFRYRRNGGSPRFGSAFFRLRESALDRSTFCYPDSSTAPVNFGTADRAGLVGIAAADHLDLLDDYVEAQVHGGVSLARDVEALVLDPCFRGTDIETGARRLPCPVEWHAGFVLGLDEVRRRPDFKTPEAVALAERITAGGLLDARILGEAARAGRHDPRTVKYVWHYIARFGRPAGSADRHREDLGLLPGFAAGAVCGDGRAAGAGVRAEAAAPVA